MRERDVTWPKVAGGPRTQKKGGEIAAAVAVEWEHGMCRKNFVLPDVDATLLFLGFALIAEVSSADTVGSLMW